MWCRTRNQLIASECAIINTTIFEMDCVSTSFGTHDTTYYLDTFADWKKKRFEDCTWKQKEWFHVEWQIR